MGRPKGALNKRTHQIKAIAVPYSVEAVRTLACIMRDRHAPAPARVLAARELLDRAFGKAPQAMAIGGAKDTIPIRIVHEHHPAP